MTKLLKSLFYRQRSQVDEKPDPLPPIQIQNMSKEELLLFAKTNEAVQTILEEKTDFTLVIVAFNRNHEEIYIMRRWNEKDGELKLLLYRGTYNYGSFLQSRVSNTIDQKKKIYIYDLQMSCRGVGNGSIALQYLIQFAVDHHVDLIAGGLAACDKDETYGFDLLERFYRRHGFQVTFDEDKTEGFLLMELS
ncbi:hypothetical protein [Paenibacillus kyungheensis]